MTILKSGDRGARTWYGMPECRRAPVIQNEEVAVASESAANSELMTFDRSRELHRKARLRTPGGVHSSARLLEQPWPLFFRSAAGSRLTDVDGNELIDYVLGQGPMLLGHNPPQVIEAVQRQMSLGLIYGGQHELEIEAAEKLVQMIPSAERVRFNMTGTEAVQSAIRVARAATGRTKVLKFQGHYDGWVDSVNFNRYRAPTQDDDQDLFRPTPESLGVPSSVAGDLLITEWNDAHRLERVLDRYGSELAAVLMEPLMANSGVIEPGAGYLERVRESCSRHGVVLIFDEIITGFRVGPGGAQGRYGVTPDLAVFGKAMASGFPLACVVGRADLFDQVDQGNVLLSGTFNAYPVGIAAAVATLALLSDPAQGVYERLESVGRELRDGLAEIARAYDASTLIQGVPELFAMSFSTLGAIRNHGDTMQSDAGSLRAFTPHLLARGVRIAGNGNWFISAAHSTEDVTTTLAAFEGALAAYSQSLG